LCYNADDPSERYNAADTMKYAGTIFLTAGHGLYSDMGRRLLTIVEDTCGRHDTIGGCCSAESNEVRYGVKATPSCPEDFLKGLPPIRPREEGRGAERKWFQERPGGPGGAVGDCGGTVKPGDYVGLRAEMNVLAVISNCPQTRNPCNNFHPTPIRV